MADLLQSLDDIFTKRLFRIPDYQRGFSWEKEHLKDFWDDLERLDDDKDHYTGLLTLKELTDADKIDKALTANDKWKIGKGFGFKVFHVVDGQQRLTTAIILINALARYFSKKNQSVIMGGLDIEQNIVSKYIRDISKTPAKSVACIFGYEQDNPSFDCLKFEIFKCGTAAFNNKEQTYYTNNLKEADKFFSEKIAELSASKGNNSVEDFFEKLLHHMKFNIHEISDGFDEYVSFETMNNRGKKLSKLELLKNRLIYLTTLFDDSYTDNDRDKLRGEINLAWMEVYHWLGKKVDSRRRDTSDDDLLRQHWIIYFKSPSRKQDELMKFFMDKKFSPKKLKRNKHAVTAMDEVDYDKIRDYAASLLEFAEPYYYTYYPQECPDISNEEKRLLDALTPSSGRLALGEFRPLVMTVLHKAKKLNPVDRLEFFKALERLIFIHSLKKNTRADFGGFSYTFAQDFYNGRQNLSDITARLKIDADNERTVNVKNFVLRVEECFDKDNEGHFRNGYYALENFLRHVLYEYECMLAYKNKLNKITDVKELFTSDRGDKISIEHIFPQTSTPYWNGIFNYNARKKAALLGSLGNLLLLSQKINSKVQNDDFSVKKNRYKNNSHSAIEVAQNSQWTATEIRNRSKKLLDFIAQHWDLNFTDEQRKKLIPLDFVP